MKFLSCSLALVALLVASNVRAELVIDDFSVYQSVSVNNSVRTAVAPIAAGTMLGGQREADLALLSSTGVNASVYVAADIAGVLDFNQDSRVASQSVLTWNGSAGRVGGVFDLTQGSGTLVNDGLALDILSNDLPLPVELTLYNGTTSFSTTISLPGGTEEKTTRFVPFSSFGGLDPKAVSKITMTIGDINHKNADLTIDNFRALPHSTIPEVPEPATWLLLAMGGCSLALYRLKK